VCRLYEKHGHSVIPFSMHDDRNFATPFSKYFLRKIDYKEMNQKKTISNGLKVLEKSIYSFEAKSKLEALLDENRIDIAHLHNIHNYHTVSILPVLKKRKIPIVWTLHDYKILCPNINFISHDKVCESCKGGSFYWCTLKKCKKNSLPASIIASVESYLNHATGAYDHVDYFLCPSDFMRKKFIEHGFPENRLIYLPNCYFQDANAVEERSKDESKNPYLLYVGRLESYKGIASLLKAFARYPKDLTLKIVGDGSQREELIALKEKLHLQNVEFLGRKSKEDVNDYLANCKFAVCPSEWYENLPFAVIEAMLASKPVVGSRIGGIPELIVDGETGFTFEPGNVQELSDTIMKMVNDPSGIIRMGKNAKMRTKQIIDPESHYRKMSEVFTKLGFVQS
jgi:glycosyltransferase involved in cell wall biosynthesis